MKKAVIVCSVASMVKLFNINNIRLLKKFGYSVSVIANFDEPGSIGVSEAEEFFSQLKKHNITVYNIQIQRSPFSIKNIKAYKEMKSIIDAENFDIIHSQSPVGGILARLAAIKTRRINQTKSIYTAHGFHFYKGAPLKNWLIYYNLEKVMSRCTDTLITINREDYKSAQKNFHSKNIEYISGVGLKLEKFRNNFVDKNITREKYGFTRDNNIVISVGEVNQNKNQEVILKAVANINSNNLHYIIVGNGPEIERLKELSKELNVENYIHFLGYRNGNEINKLLKMSDIFAFPSIREGLGMAALEAMACGLPIVTSNVHGINDYSIEGVTGFKCDPYNIEGFSKNIHKLINNSKLRNKISNYNMIFVEKFSEKKAIKKMEKIYMNTIKNN